jgi:dimethylhistidine N-methyltransferase
VLEALRAPAAYVPVDISGEHLARSASAISSEYPSIEVLPLHADYMDSIALPTPSRRGSRVLCYFPGSTIGNLMPNEVAFFLRRVRAMVGAGGALLVGVDLKKDPALLHAAYNDARGVTAEFNRNVLARINRELEADFPVDAFHHSAFYNPTVGRIEMHLVSARRQTVRVGEATFAFAEGEAIVTEYSYKYTLDDFARVAAEGSFAVERTWTDGDRLFSVQYLT